MEMRFHLDDLISWEDIHIYPVNEEYEHITCIDCKCNPSLCGINENIFLHNRIIEEVENNIDDDSWCIEYSLSEVENRSSLETIFRN